MGTRARLDYIDGLRGIAASTVMLQHVAERVEATGLPSRGAENLLTALFVHWANFGRFGVGLFFLVSGFVIPFSLSGPRPLRHFAISRLFRLYPAFWVSLAFAVPLLAFTDRRDFTSFQVAANATMLHPLFAQGNVLGAYWTLYIEVVFYGLIGWLFTAGMLQRTVSIARCSAALLGMAVAFVLIGGALHTNMDMSLPRYLSLMLLGTAWRQDMLQGGRESRRWCWTLTLAHLAALPLLYGAIVPIGENDTRFGGVTAWSFSYALAILAFLAAIHWRRTPGRVATFLGRISYSLYLVHGVWLSIIGWAFPLDGSWFGAARFVVLMIVTSLLSSLALFHGVERPAIAMGKALLARVRHRDAIAQLRSSTV